MKQARILVVDDHRTNQLKLMAILKQQGYQVETAGDGLQALEMLRSQPFDLMLLDIIMPTMDGYAVLKQLYQDETLPDIPVIVTSAFDTLEEMTTCFELRAVDYITKPFQLSELQTRLKTHLTIRQLQQTLKAQQTKQASALNRLDTEATKRVQLLMSNLTHVRKLLEKGQEIEDLDKVIIGYVDGLTHLLTQLKTDLTTVKDDLRNIEP